MICQICKKDKDVAVFEMRYDYLILKKDYGFNRIGGVQSVTVCLGCAEKLAEKIKLEEENASDNS